jgi:hypothetical protein
LFGFSSFAQESGIVSMVSPKLRQFLKIHPDALQVLTNTVSEAFTRKSLQLYYFYTTNDFVDRSYHYYPSDSVVGVCIRENQEPLDEFISLVFETLNSENEDQFQTIIRKAESGDVSRNDFAQEIIKIEFIAEKQVIKTIEHLKLTEKEKSDSHFYKEEVACPDEFKDYISYIRQLSPGRDPVKAYEAQYDLLRKP